MLRTTSFGRLGGDVEAATDLVAARHEVPAIRHRDDDLLSIAESFSAVCSAVVADCGLKTIGENRACG